MWSRGTFVRASVVGPVCVVLVLNSNHVPAGRYTLVELSSLITGAGIRLSPSNHWVVIAAALASLGYLRVLYNARERK